jgi:hypothetical protein
VPAVRTVLAWGVRSVVTVRAVPAWGVRSVLAVRVVLAWVMRRIRAGGDQIILPWGVRAVLAWVMRHVRGRGVRIAVARGKGVAGMSRGVRARRRGHGTAGRQQDRRRQSKAKRG